MHFRTSVPVAAVLVALLNVVLGVDASLNNLVQRQSDSCSGLPCPGNAKPCSDECTCINPLELGSGECVPSSCVGVSCTSNADCCTTPLLFICLIPEGLTTGICAPSLPPIS
ncbi:hypothetical protein GY45DRAFT_1330040 [Cubamyces sp. BRFM 1775]|nr:hypothetical protein GY45DRAFT_1330040 [Cubamyces sp. BRFM 1775]